MFESLKLKNFKRHADVDLTFSDGLQLIVGKNFTGKSSLLHGILYAWWGPQAVPGGKSVITRKGADSPVSVEHGFKINGDNYLIARSDKKVSVSKNGEVQAKSASAVNAYLENLIGMNRERFLQLRYAEQKNTEALLTLGTTKLHSIVEEVSGASLVSEVITSASAALSQVKGGLISMPEVDVQQAIDREKELKSALNLLASTIKLEQTALTEMEEELSTATQAHEKAAEFNRAEQARQKELQEVEVELRTCENEIAHSQQVIDAAGNADEVLQQIKTELDASRETLIQAEAYARQLASAKRAVDVLTTRASQSRKLFEESEQSLQALPPTESLDPLQSAMTDTAAAFSQTKSDRAKILTALKEGVCPECLRPFEGYDQEALEQDRVRLEEELKRTQAEAQAAKANFTAVKAANIEVEKLQQQRDSHRQTWEQQTADLELAKQELDSIGFQDLTVEGAELAVTAIQGKYDDTLATVNEVKAARRALDNALHSEALIKETLEKLGGQAKELVDLKPLLMVQQAANKRFHDAKSLLAYHEGSYKGQYGEWQAATTALEKARQAHEAHAQLAARKLNLEQFLKFLRTNRDRFLASVWEGILNYASLFTTTCTDGVIQRVQRDDSGVFSFTERDVDQPIEAASGAQRSIMGLGVQLALSHLLPCPLSTLLLDEPTADLDAEHSLAMTSLLASESGQVIMISHRDMDSAVAGDVLNTAELA